MSTIPDDMTLRGVEDWLKIHHFNDSAAAVARARAALAATGTPQVPSDAQMDEIVRACLTHGPRYAFVGDRAFPAGRDEIRAKITAALASQGAAPTARSVAWENKLLDEAGDVQRTSLDSVGPQKGDHGVPGWKWVSRPLAYADTQGAAPTGAGDAEPAIGAWENDMGLVISAAQKQTMIDGGGASMSVSRSYTTPLYRAAPQQPAEAAPGEIDAMRADAERYREFIGCGLPITFLGTDYRSKSELDAAIDAALANNKGAT